MRGRELVAWLIATAATGLSVLLLAICFAMAGWHIFERQLALRLDFLALGRTYESQMDQVGNVVKQVVDQIKAVEKKTDTSELARRIAQLEEKAKPTPESTPGQ